MTSPDGSREPSGSDPADPVDEPPVVSGSPQTLLGAEPWAVLGGGGLKGLAHVGAWRALEEAGIEPVGIVGTSIGALMAVCLGAGMTWGELDVRARKLKREDIVRIQRRAVWINGVKSPSLYQGEPLREYLSSIVPLRAWDDLRIPVQVNAVDLATGTMEWFGPGARTDVSPLDAVVASASLPVLYPPVRIQGRYAVDGGVADAFPVSRAVELGASGIVGVDVGSAAEGDAEKVVELGMVAVHQRIFSIMAGRRRREVVEGWSGPPLVYVRPRVDGYSGFEFDAVPYFLREGYVAASSALS